MTIPPVRDFFAPILQVMQSHAGEFHKREAYEPMAQFFNLSIEETQERLPSGVRKFDNRVNWALSWLKLTGYLEQTGTSRYQLTSAGRTIAQKAPTNFSKQVVQEYNLLKQNTLAGEQSVKPISQPIETTTSPLDSIEESYQILYQTLQLNILERIQAASPAFFEDLIVKLLLKMGYGGAGDDAGQVVGGSNDGGIDGIIKQDAFGLDVIYLQAKRWKGNVGSPEIINFMGALTLKNAHKGVFITTSDFTPDATRQAQSPVKNVVLINGKKLTELMIKYDVGISVKNTFLVKDIDEDFFSE